MPPEMDDNRIAAIHHLITASQVVFMLRAHGGHPLKAEPDDMGLIRLFGPRDSRAERELKLLQTMAAFLEAGGRPNRLDESYGTVYEFRLVCEQTPIYIKTQWPPNDAASPVLVICSVKKQN